MRLLAIRSKLGDAVKLSRLVAAAETTTLTTPPPPLALSGDDAIEVELELGMPAGATCCTGLNVFNGMDTVDIEAGDPEI